MLKSTFIVSAFLLSLLAANQPRALAAEANWDAYDNMPAADADEATPEQNALEDLLNGSDASDKAGPASYRMVVEVFKRPSGLNINKEFGIVTIDGVFQRVFVVSTAIAQTADGQKHRTVEGTFPLVPQYRRGVQKADTERKPFPWIRSATYHNSAMFWGLYVSPTNGYYIHSTPHYSHLGHPASMGCVRVSFPTSMYLFDHAVNVVKGSAQIKIYGSGTKEAADAFAATKLDSGWVTDRINEELDKVHAITKTDYNGTGHAWVGEKLVYPSCDGVDCFKYFGQAEKIN